MPEFSTSLTVQTFTHDEWLAEAERLFGPDARDWRFECPACNHVASGREWIEAGAPSTAVAFSCIGRWLPKPREAFANGAGPCNYAGGGLIGLNPVRVMKADGTRIDAFAFAAPREGAAGD